MPHEIELLLVPRWKELEHDLTHKNRRRVEIHDYLLKADYPNLPFERLSVYWNFLDIWDEIGQIYWNLLDTWNEVGQCSNRTIAKNIETSFFVEWDNRRNRKKNEILLDDFSLSPDSVREIAKVTENFDLDSYLVYFEPDSPPDNFPDVLRFRIYSQAWLDCFNIAAANDAGIIIRVYSPLSIARFPF